eukprot:TRINITY_DN18640_c0_g1_i1.p1 TRINITY_DN18640_c0_g1~~TRINITY_DN18640_c0_g1_i1.p1  ORF type:complete len:458 (-),score=99.26 TRINITY_DN18640_c0_g1_i1:113-1486(-)
MSVAGKVDASKCPFGKAGDVQPDCCAFKYISSEEAIDFENEYAAHNYHPLPMVFERAQGVDVWDPEGRHYFDFLSSYSAVNQGHCHPKIIKALTLQAERCTLSSRAFYNSVFPRYARYVTEYFGFESVLPMNSGAEAVETALKLARKWAYDKKGVPENEAVIISCEGCFHGRTLAIVSMSSDPDCRVNFGPYLPGLATVPFNDASALGAVLERIGSKVAGFIVEPIQGEAGVVVPNDGYLAECARLCRQHNVLFIADEIQTGLCRSGKLLACDWDGVRPDVLILGKALSGGTIPISAVLASKEIMYCLRPGHHGSTFGGSPLAAAVGIASLEVLKDENLADQAQELGTVLRRELENIKKQHPFVTAVRGRGLLNAIEIDEDFHTSAWDICLKLKDNGLLAKPTHNHIIRLAPPLVMTHEQLGLCIGIIRKTFDEVATAGLSEEQRLHHIGRCKEVNK